MTTAVRLNARLDPELARKLAELQRRSGQSTTEVIRSALERYYDAEEKGFSALDMLEETGFVGCADGPRDLSSNYKAELTRTLRKKSRK